VKEGWWDGSEGAREGGKQGRRQRRCLQHYNDDDVMNLVGER
jgi:hypothetical protein